MAVRLAAPAALTTILVLAGPVAAQDSDPGDNAPPVAIMEVRDQYQGHGHFLRDYYEIDASNSYDPDGHIVTTRFLTNGNSFEAGFPSSLYDTWMHLGPQHVGVEVTDDQGATDLTSDMFWVEARPSVTYDPGPWADPRLRRKATALFVPRYYRTAKLNRHGLPIRVECAMCSVHVELQLTRYRARRLGLRGPFPEPKITMAYAAAGFPPREQHRFRLRPSARFRKALRRRRAVPILLKVRTIGFISRSRTITAEIELAR